MAAPKILQALKDKDGYHFLVHLDPEQTVTAREAHELRLTPGGPHPYFLRTWTFGLPHAAHTVTEDDGQTREMTEDEYLASVKEMLREQAALELQGMRFYRPAPPPHEPVPALEGMEL